MNNETGLVHIYYGNGKGKTTAAAGLALRAAGHGIKTLFVQFLKGGESGEITVFSTISNIEVLRGKAGAKFFSAMTPEEREQTTAVHNANLELAAKAVMAGECGLLVLDEALDAYIKGALDREKLLALLRNKPRELEIVMTGHKLSEELAGFADYITEMVKRKHPFDNGVDAREGVEF